MKAYRVYPSEITSFTDRETGVAIKKLTGYLGHSTQPYFTFNGWFDGGRKMLFNADRHNASNLHCIDMETGEISQLTDLVTYKKKPAFTMDVNPKRNETYFWQNGCAYALNLSSLEIRPLWVAPKGFNTGSLSPTADGDYLLTGLTEDLSDRIYSNLSASYIGFREIFEAKPDCRIMRISLDGGGAEAVWREKCWVGHVNPSCTQANILTFCHEGPWNLVDHRMWVLDLDTGKATKLRERRVEGEMIGHEYWHLDGLHVGYQVHKPGAGSYFGFAKYDGTNELEAPCVRYPGPDHIHSNDFNLVVSDSGKTIKVYSYTGNEFDGPRILCMHDSSFHHQFTHPHPRMTADGRHVIYNSDCEGYCNIYMAEIPEDTTTLPKLEIPKENK